ncbi:spermidine/putrescine ABC transporter [Rouxiella silvae]|uniref:Spermidine/putrescine ABC transporter n=1 Tax=Rouxiella silvae TaxID=1646373 RepID=A0ABX3U458_9GAMM|nr:iron-containing redox enzyme family protein [Rouxiella silvae]ORJ22260.1 spermidine/putrescine ABC transporter [Rouxiella silvae]
MFNLDEIKSTIKNDRYNFTQKIISHINQQTPYNIKESDSDIDRILTEAYDKNGLDAQKVVQNALFMIYQINLCSPLSSTALFQYDPTLLSIRGKIETRWLSHEFTSLQSLNFSSNFETCAEFLINLWKNHNASHHPLFDFIESKATEEQLYFFLKSDSALNLLFFDLVAYTLIGAPPQTRGTICENIWDEIGHGDSYFTHVNLYKDLLERRNIALPENHFIELYGVEAIAGHNAFMLGGVNRCHYYKLLGVMAMTEVLDPPQYSKLVKGCARLGLTAKDTHYYTEHIDVDIKHGEDWLYKVINVITLQQPQASNEFYLGSLLRLNTAERYYDNLLSEIKKI